MTQLRTPPIFSYDAHLIPLSHYLRAPIPTVPSTFPVSRHTLYPFVKGMLGCHFSPL